jgi:hypothetical protein
LPVIEPVGVDHAAMVSRCNGEFVRWWWT